MRPVFDSTSSSLKIACTVLLLGTVVVSAPTQAEESLTYLETAGRYADLQREAERRISTGRDSSATPLGYLCIAYGKLKQYEKLFDCAAKLDERIQRGDAVMELDQRVMFISSSDARPLPETLRARAYFELGDFPKAAASGAASTGNPLPHTGNGRDLSLPNRSVPDACPRSPGPMRGPYWRREPRQAVCEAA